MKVKFLLCLRACTILIALTGLHAEATTTSYTWANTGGGSLTWTAGANWTVGGVSTGNTPGTTQSGSNYDEASISNTGSLATTITTPNSGTLTFDTLTVGLSGSNGNLTLDIAGNLTTTHAAGTLVDTFSDTSTSSVLIVNVQAGTYTSDSEGFVFDAKAAGSQFNIASGATALALTTGNNNATFGANGSSADTFNVSGILAEDSTSTTGTGFYAAGTNTFFRLGASTLNINSGGSAILNGLVETNASGTNGTSNSVNITGGTLTVRYGSEGIYMGANANSNYYNSITEANATSGGGTVLNNGQLAIGAVDGTTDQVGKTNFYQGVTVMTIGNAGTGGSSGNTDTWTQNGMTAIGNGLVGSLTVNPTGTFDAHDVYLGGGTLQTNVQNPTISSYGSTLASSLTVGSTTYTKLTASGTLVLNGGTVDITNPYAGTSFTAASAGTQSSLQYFTPSATTGGQPFVGERIEFTSLTGATGTGLSLNTPYYVVYSNKGSNTFGVSTTPGGAQIAGVENYTSATYKTLGSVLDIGSTMYFSGGGSTVIPGILTLNSGTLSVDELDTNNSTGSAILNGASGAPAAATINFNGGTLIIGASNPNTTTVPNSGALASLTVGNGGSTAAFLQFAGGTSSVPQALANAYSLSSNATLDGYGYVSATTTSNGGTINGNGGVLGSLTLSGLVTESTGGNTLSGAVIANAGVSIVSSATVSQSGTLTGSVSNSSSGSSTFSGVIAGSSSSASVSAGTVTFSNSTGNSYGNGTTLTGGTLYVNNGGGASYTAPASSANRTIMPTNTTGSGTGTGSVTVMSGGKLAGSGTIASTSGGITVQSGGTLSSGGVQSGTSAGTGLTINNSANLSSALVVDGGATLTFALGSTTQWNGGSGANNFAAPNTNSTYISLTGMTTDQIFADTTTADNINLVDLTNGSPTVSLTLRAQNPYLLIQTDLGNNADFMTLVTTNGTTTSLGGNGYVLGVSTGTGLNYTAFDINAYNLSGMQISSSTNLENLRLYLYNGDLEVVPEPGTWALMLGGLAALIIIQRRRSRD